MIPNEIFREYDIRGIADTDLTDDNVYLIGRAIGSEVISAGLSDLLVARDGRLSSQRIEAALTQGVLSVGCNVVSIGMVPTPILYFGTHTTGTTSGVMITGSHNPAEYNGFKVVIAQKALSGATISNLRDRVVNDAMCSFGTGLLSSVDVESNYYSKISNDIRLATPVKVVFDAGNGVAGKCVVELFEKIGCTVIPLFCEVDGTFPNHHPNPSDTRTLDSLTSAIKLHNADFGVAFDGDGDRIGVVVPSGRVILAEELIDMFATDILPNYPNRNTVIYDVMCSNRLSSAITRVGGNPILSKTGHSNIKAEIANTNAIFAGEASGHLYFNDRWYGVDDALYAAARLIELVSKKQQSIDELCPTTRRYSHSVSNTFDVTDSTKFETIRALSNVATNLFGEKATMLDGVRIDGSGYWGIIRASNTTPSIVLRIEASSAEILELVKFMFNSLFIAAKCNLKL